jgi:hypothetical protein
MFSAKVCDGVVVSVATKRVENGKERGNSSIGMAIERLRSIGVKVMMRESIWARFAVIDQKIVWYGNCNFLGYESKETNVMRISDDCMAMELLEHVHT